MIHHILRYFGISLLAAMFGVFGGSLAANKAKNNPPTLQSQTASQTIPATPAQPFPGQGISAIPAVPATPGKADSGVKNPTIAYVQQNDAGGYLPKNKVGAAGTLYKLYDSSAVGLSFSATRDGNPDMSGCVMWKDVCLAWGSRIIGSNFLPKHNSVYWDGILITKDVDSIAYSNDLQEMIVVLTPPDAKLGSFHKVRIENAYGASNEVEVQVLESVFGMPVVTGDFLPNKGSIGTKVLVPISGFGGFSDAPLSTKVHVSFGVPASMVKNGAEGEAQIFFPLEKSSSNSVYSYSFTVANKGIYCPSWLWDLNFCTLASADAAVTTPSGQYYNVYTWVDLNFQYRGRVVGSDVYYGMTLPSSSGVLQSRNQYFYVTK